MWSQSWVPNILVRVMTLWPQVGTFFSASVNKGQVKWCYSIFWYHLLSFWRIITQKATISSSRTLHCVIRLSRPRLFGQQLGTVLANIILVIQFTNPKNVLNYCLEHAHAYKILHWNLEALKNAIVKGRNNMTSIKTRKALGECGPLPNLKNGKVERLLLWNISEVLILKGFPGNRPWYGSRPKSESFVDGHNTTILRKIWVKSIWDTFWVILIKIMKT